LIEQTSAPASIGNHLAASSIAVVHEWFGATGGSERVFQEISALIPGARRFVLWKDADVTEDLADVSQSWMSRTPLRHRKAMALPLMPLAWRTLTAEKFDVVISSSHAFAHTVRLRGAGDTRHLSYIHSPARYVWSADLDSRGGGSVMAPARWALRRLDVSMSRHVNGYAANSVEVRDRIRRYWQRDATVINPPVDTEYYRHGSKPRSAGGDYLLGVGRWVSYKRFDLMIEIADRAGVPIVIAGGGPAETELRKLGAKKRVSVEFVTRPSNEQLRNLYRGARALLYPAHEDFGMIPVEAQAAGCPVIGLARGGLLETVVHGSTGFLVHGLDPAGYVAAVRDLDELDPQSAICNAERFSRSRFRENMLGWLLEETR
jgi:glycosyltransferase involved in cell wall biosynthesis